MGISPLPAGEGTWETKQDMDQGKLTAAMTDVQGKFAAYKYPPALLPAIEKQMRQQQGHFFHIPFETEVHSKHVYAELGFRWDKIAGHHRLDSLGIHLQKDGANKLDTNIFSFQEGSIVSVEQAFNLMQGRPVWKDKMGQESEWLILDPAKQVLGMATPESKILPFRLSKALENSPLGKMLSAGMKYEITVLLQNGNRTQVRLPNTGRVYYLEARPEQGRLALQDGKGRELPWKELKWEGWRERRDRQQGMKR